MISAVIPPFIVRSDKMLNKLDGWQRIALVFSITLITCVICLLPYERLAVIGDTSGPRA